MAYRKNYHEFDHSEIYGELKKRSLIPMKNEVFHWFWLIAFTVIVTLFILSVIYYVTFPRDLVQAVHASVMKQNLQHYWQVKFSYDLTHQMSTTTY
jgi:hypothetical protein